MSAPTRERVEVKCFYCGRTFKTTQGLSSHERHRHWWESGCPLCEGGGGSACWWHFL